MISNPFDITKAVDYTDAEIYKYWVDLGNENHGFERLIKPDTLIPMIIVGSKGSGKTHVMKYFSYELQKIRCLAQSTSMQEESLLAFISDAVVLILINLVGKVLVRNYGLFCIPTFGSYGLASGL